MGMIVLLRGVVRGMGREAECEVVALRQIAATKSKFRRPKSFFRDFGVIEAPNDLPDGEYTVRVGDQILNTAKVHGIWLTCTELPQHGEKMSRVNGHEYVS